MASLTGPRYIAAPNSAMSRSQFFKVSTGPLDMPAHAGSGGVEYQISWCGLPNCYEVECIGSHNTKTFPGGFDTITALPFVVYSTISCSPVGMSDEMMQKGLFDQLVAGEQQTVESTFSAQLCGQAPGLSDNSETHDVGAGTDIVNAVALLENYLYVTTGYGPVGVLHVPLVLAAYFEYLHLGKLGADGIWRTALGTKINFGNYLGNDPGGAAPAAGVTWMYITGQTTVWRVPDSDLFSPTRGEMLTRTTNLVTGVMEREYIVSFDCAVGGASTPISGVVE